MLKKYPLLRYIHNLQFSNSGINYPFVLCYLDNPANFCLCISANSDYLNCLSLEIVEADTSAAPHEILTAKSGFEKFPISLAVKWEI